MAFTCLFLLFLVALSSGSITPPNPPQFVYRTDFREHQLIFQTGMQSHGTCENVYYHVQGRNCKAKTSAFIATTSSKPLADEFAELLLRNAPKKESITVYKIRADPTFYSAYYSLMNAAETYHQKGKAKKAQKYATLADDYKYQQEWMAYRRIPVTLIKEATRYTRSMLFGGSSAEKADVVPNPAYETANTYASQEAFPGSTKGCLPGFLQSLKACVLSDDEEKKILSGTKHRSAGGHTH